MWSMNSRISSRASGRANHCMLFFTKICMAVQWIERARSIAMLTPPRMDMCAPSRICELRLTICDFFVCRTIGLIENRKSKNLKYFWVPVRFLQAPCACVFEEFVHRREQHAGAVHVQAQTEIEFVVEKMNIAVTQHAEERASGLEIVGVNNAVLDLEIRGPCARDAVSAAGEDFIQNSRERPEDRDGEDVAIAYLHFSIAAHRAPISAQTGEIIRAFQHALRGLVVVVQISQQGKIDLAYRDACPVTGIISRQRDVSISTQGAGEKSAADISDL